MQAIRVHETGGPEQLRLETVDAPTPTPGHALVRLEAIGVNFIDVYHRVGLYPMQRPFTPGSEGAGVVEAIGGDVTDVKVGDRVAFTGVPGTYATHIVAPADRLVILPDGVSARQGAAIMLQGLTAHYLATSTYPLARGEWCVVHAAAGGVGLLLCQLARMRGARVIGTASTPEKIERARAAGAEIMVNYTEESFREVVRRVTGGMGLGVVYDSVGKSTFEDSLGCLRRRGMLVLFGQSSGAVPPFDVQLLSRNGSLFLTRPTLADYIATRAELVARCDDLFRWVAEGRLDVRIDREVPLANAADAHRALEARETSGKVLLIP